MRLYAQTILIVALTVISVAAVLLITFELTVMSSYSTLEQEYVSQDLYRAENVINSEILRLTGIARDWAIWDDTYAYVKNRDSAYETSNLAATTLESLNIIAISIYDSEGLLINGLSRASGTGKTGPLSSDLDLLFQNSGINLISDKGMTGILSGQKQPVIIASHPILTSKREGPVMGMVVVADILDDAKVQSLSNDVLRNITISPLDLKTQELTDIIPLPLFSDGLPEESRILSDISGNPAYLLTVHEPKELSQSGTFSRLFFLSSLFLLIILFMGLASWILNRIIITPLQVLNKDLLEIGKSGSLSGRIPSGRRDEIGDLTSSINSMLISLERAQQDRITSEQRLSRLIDLVEEGICLIGPDGLIWFANPTMASIFDTTPYGLTGISIDSLLIPEGTDLSDEAQSCVPCLTPGQHEYHNRTITGREIWVRVATAPYPLDTGKMGHLCVVTDITPFRTAERKLLLSNKKLALLGSMTRHDIVNQLTTIRGMLGLIKRKNMDHALDQLITSAEDASERINKHIEFSKEYQKAGIEAPRWQDVHTVWNLAYAMTRRRGLTFAITGDTYEIYADQLLQKVFYNLIENTLRHGKDVFYITVSTQREDSDLLIRYEDDGGGIPDSMKNRIFERGVGTGTGWGLFFAHEVLDLTGMSISEMGTYGIGAAFIIRVPEGVFRPVSPEKVIDTGIIVTEEEFRKPSYSDSEDDPCDKEHDD